MAYQQGDTIEANYNTFGNVNTMVLAQEIVATVYQRSRQST